MILMQQSSPRPRRLRAAFIGFGLDSGDDEQRLDPRRPDLDLRRLGRDPCRIAGDRAQDGARAQPSRPGPWRARPERARRAGRHDRLSGTARNRDATPGGSGTARASLRRPDCRRIDRALSVLERSLKRDSAVHPVLLLPEGQRFPLREGPLALLATLLVDQPQGTRFVLDELDQLRRRARKCQRRRSWVRRQPACNTSSASASSAGNSS